MYKWGPGPYLPPPTAALLKSTPAMDNLPGGSTAAPDDDAARYEAWGDAVEDHSAEIFAVVKSIYEDVATGGLYDGDTFDCVVRPRLVGHLCVKHSEAEQHAVELVFVAQYHVAIVVGFLEFEQPLQQEFELHNVAQGGRVLARRGGRRRAEAEAVQLRERRQGRGRSAVHEG